MNRALLCPVIVIAIVTGFTITAQLSSQVEQQRFEVASIKPTQVAGGVREACHGIDSKRDSNDPNAGVPLGRCVVVAGRLSHMIGMAYDVSMDMVHGGPEWVMTGADRFDVEAKAEDPATATEDQLIAMFRALLAERFKLKFHREPREMPGFALVVGKNGSKLQESGADDHRKISIISGGRAEPDAIKGAPEGVLMTLTAEKLSLADLVRLLVPYARGHILDETHLTGLYNLKLTWEAGQSISGPLQDQLGLRLEPRKVPVQFFIVESAEKPTTN